MELDAMNFFLDPAKIYEYAGFYAVNYPDWNSCEVITDLIKQYKRGEDPFLNDLSLGDAIAFIKKVGSAFERLLFLACFKKEREDESNADT